MAVRNELHVCFIDDARRPNPSRPGMTELVGIGGIVVPSSRLANLERAVGGLCAEFGFPAHQEFKWSPSRDHWMRDGLVGARRQDFYLRLIALLEEDGCRAIVVASDTNCNPATSFADTAEQDVTTMLVERLDNRLRDNRAHGIVIADRPGGGREQEDAFVEQVADLLERGTKYVQPDRIALSVLVTDSHRVRLLQAADVVVSASLAYIGGESRFSPRVFKTLLPLFYRDYGRTGGVGFKLHPDLRYANLYHWLLEDETFVRYQVGHPMPLKGRAYFTGPDDFDSMG